MTGRLVFSVVLLSGALAAQVSAFAGISAGDSSGYEVKLLGESGLEGQRGRLLASARASGGYAPKIETGDGWLVQNEDYLAARVANHFAIGPAVVAWRQYTSRWQKGAVQPGAAFVVSYPGWRVTVFGYAAGTDRLNREKSLEAESEVFLQGGWVLRARLGISRWIPTGQPWLGYRVTPLAEVGVRWWIRR